MNSAAPQNKVQLSKGCSSSAIGRGRSEVKKLRIKSRMSSACVLQGVEGALKD
jgi:hypothetical protein